MVPAKLAVATSLPPNLNPNPTKSNRKNTPTSHSQNQLIPLIHQCKSIANFSQIHTLILKSGKTRDSTIVSKSLRLLSIFNSTDYASKIFRNIESPDIYQYTALISVMIVAKSYLDAIQLYSQMIADAIMPDPIAISSALNACGLRMALREGRQIHGQILKLRYRQERLVRMKLIELYGKCGELRDAKRVFDEMPERDAVAATILINSYSEHGLIDEAQTIFGMASHRDTVCWTSMIDGCVRNGRNNAALDLFREMQKEKVRPNEVTVVCVLSACSQLGALELGRWIDSYVDNRNIRRNAYVGSALIDMYSKCGSLEEASRVFNEMVKRDVIAYNSMITGLALHGRSAEAVKLYRGMVREGLNPTHVTFVGVLNACSHGGLVDLGFEIFGSMTKEHGLDPKIEHYGCMVDLLGRVGQLQEAYEFILGMRIKPDQVIWSALLGACRVHGNLTLGQKLAAILIGNETMDAGTYVLLSNVYASFGKWEEAVRIRTAMKEQGIQKEPGCSSIEVDNEIHEFLLGDIKHPRREEIYKRLDVLNDALKLEGYSPARDVVLQDIEEGQKEWALAIHSERLAICFGLIAMKPGATIRVVKNLRVCIDCHSMIKLVAKIEKRKIVVRDRNRFHHFEDGHCSCGDYW